MTLEAGRIAYVNFGEDHGKLVVIVDIADQNRVLVDGDDFQRVLYPLKSLTLTKLVVPIQRGARTGTLKQAAEAFGLDEKWSETTTSKNKEKSEENSNLSDFERFKAMR